MNISRSKLRSLKIFDPSWWKEKKTPLYYTSSSLTVSMAQMASGILLVRWIIPEELGLWTSIKLALTYSSFLLPGILNGLSRELPFTMGSNKTKKANMFASTALLCTIIVCILSIIGGIGTAIYYSSAGQHIILSILAITMLVVFTFYRNYLIVTYRSKSSFNRLASVKISEAVLMLATLPSIYFLQYNGVLLRAVIVALVVLILMHITRPMRVKPTWERNSFNSLAKTGVPIFALDYIRSAASTFDVVILLYFGNIKIVGYYALAKIVAQTMSTIPISIGNYLYPRMSFTYGKNRDTHHLWILALKGLLVVFVLMIPIAVTGWILIPKLVGNFFPEYAQGVGAAQITLVTAIFAGISVCVNALWSMKAWRWMVIYQVSYSILLLLGPTIGVFLFDLPLKGVAYGMLFANIINFLIGMSLTYFVTMKRGQQIEKLLDNEE